MAFVVLKKYETNLRQKNQVNLNYGSSPKMLKIADVSNTRNAGGLKRLCVIVQLPGSHCFNFYRITNVKFAKAKVFFLFMIGSGG